MPAPDGPSILTTPPVSLPVPQAPRTIVPPSSPPPYRTAGVVAASRPSAARVVTERPAPPPAPVEETVPVGDRAGEHLFMTRGRYRAMAYVVIAYVMECGLLGWLPILLLQVVLRPFTSDTTVATVLGLSVGAVLAWFVFRDRWRCIEAFSSRFCSGLMNLSILYVPFVALAYANVRGLAKRRGA